MGSKLTPDQINQAGELAIFMVMVGLLGIGLLSMAYGRIMDWRYRLIMSSESADDGYELSVESPPQPPVQTLVPADTNAVPAGSGAGTKIEPVPEPSYRMSDITIIALLAVQKDEKGADRFSANDIAALIGK